MADVNATAIAIVSSPIITGGLTVFGIATGLEPSLLIAGFAGALWAQSYREPAPVLHRVALTLLGAILAAYLTPAPAMALASVSMAKQASISASVLQWPIAVLIGLLAHSVLGPALVKLIAKKAEDAAK